MDRCLVIGTENQLWVVNPSNKQRLRLNTRKKNKDHQAAYSEKVLDVYSSNNGISHATERVKKEPKIVKRGNTEYFPVNFVQVYDSIVGKPVFTAHPADTQRLPLEERMVPLDFSFSKRDGSLMYTLNGIEGMVFPNSNGSMEQSGKTEVKGNRVYFDGRRIY